LDGRDRLAGHAAHPGADINRRWRLDVGPPFEPGGNCAWVAPAVDADGCDLVVKVG